MFVSHKTVSYRLFRISNAVRRVAQGTKGVSAAGFYIEPTAEEKARVRLRVKLQEAQEWLNWAVSHLLWLEELNSNEITEGFDINNPPKPPEGYLW